jgi:hypothetical protein
VSAWLLSDDRVSVWDKPSGTTSVPAKNAASPSLLPVRP